MTNRFKGLALVDRVPKDIWTEISSKKTGGNISCTDGRDKDKNGKDLIKAEKTKKRWQEYTEQLYKTGLNDPDNHSGVRHSPGARYPGL